MKSTTLILFLSFLTILSCKKETNTTEGSDSKEEVLKDYWSLMQIDSGNPVSIMLTSYSTTLIANGKNETRLRVAVIDSLGKEITSAQDSIQVYVTGNGTLKSFNDEELTFAMDSIGNKYVKAKLTNGVCNLKFIVGSEADKVKVEVKSGKLWPGSHEIHTVPSDFAYKTPTKEQLPLTTKKIDKMIGADISWLPQLEHRGRKFYENDSVVDAIELLKEHGFNYIRLRIFVNPENEKGYSPEEGFCNLEHTKQMAKRIKEAGLKFLLDFHYSDYWADPQQQFKPKAWENLTYEELKEAVTEYTTEVLNALKAQNTLPDMVQVGNEINHGMIWPDGHIGNPDGLAGLLKSGVKGVRNVDQSIPIMVHIALGGQNEEAVFWLDNMLARGVEFDILGLSYYPRWHGTLNDLNANMHALVKHYHKPINVVEYSDCKMEVHDIVFNLPNDMGKGAAIWEPLSWRTNMFDNQGNVVEDVISIYDELHEKYLGK